MKAGGMLVRLEDVAVVLKDELGYAGYDSWLIRA